MNTVLRATPTVSADRWTALGAALALGCGAMVALAGVAGSNLTAAAAGGVLAAVGLTILVATDWLDGVVILALSLPLPVLYSSDSLRIAAIAPINAIVVFAWVLNTGTWHRRVQLGELPMRATLALVGAFALAAVFASHPLTSARELLNFGVQIALLVAATDLFSRDAGRVERMVSLLVAIASVCGVLAVLESVTVLPGQFPRWGTRFYRAALAFGQPNALGLFLASALPLAVHELTVARTPLRRVAVSCALGAVALGLVSTFSRGSWLSVLAGTSLLMLARDGRFVLKVWTITLLFAAAIDVASGGILTDTVQRTVGDWVIEQRAALMLAGVLMFLAHPILGVGPGGFADELDRFGAQIPQLFDYLATPHNAYVQMAAETGVVGLFAFVLFLVAVLQVLIRRARKAREDPAVSDEERSLRRALLWSFATVCFAGFVVWPFAHGTGQVVMLIAAAGCAVQPLGLRDGEVQ
jgi:putative inorganic carbon (HCO3(-)) transporter